MGAGIKVAEARATVLVRFAAISGVLSGFEAATKIAFVFVKVSALRLVSFFLRSAEAYPPHFTGAVNAFGTGIFQSAANGFGLRFIVLHCDHDGMALPQRVFIDEQFVFRESFSGGAFHRSTSGATSDRAEDASC